MHDCHFVTEKRLDAGATALGRTKVSRQLTPRKRGDPATTRGGGGQRHPAAFMLNRQGQEAIRYPQETDYSVEARIPEEALQALGIVRDLALARVWMTAATGEIVRDVPGELLQRYAMPK